MNKISNIEFESLLQHEEFIRLLNENPQEADRLIEDLYKENPGKEESIRLAVKLLLYYKAEQMDFDRDEITKMWKNILHKSENRKQVRIFPVAPVWRIAASVAILLSLTFYFFEYSRTNSIRRFAEAKVAISDEARIIKSDGSEYRLRLNNSHIKYENDGKEIVIEEKNDQTEKLTNQQPETKAVFNQIVVPYGRRHSVTLCDGTVVQLNSGSKLVFPAKFPGSKREVFLKGEGYFEVHKDVSKLFIVHTDFINVKVLGTHFNISAYEDEKSATTVLVEGSVEVYNNNFLNNNLCKIKPGEGCFYTDNASGFKIRNVDVNEYVSWKEGYLQIKDQKLGDITKKVEKYYNRKIAIEDNELAQRIISGKLILHSQLEGTLDFLAKTTRSQYKLKEGGIYGFFKNNNN
jgi:transmembrane sensor